MLSTKVTFIFLIISLALGFVFYFMNPKTDEYIKKNNSDIVCTMDVLECPDGSYVGRQGPNCEFPACPIPEGAIMEDGTIIE